MVCDLPVNAGSAMPAPIKGIIVPEPLPGLIGAPFGDYAVYACVAAPAPPRRPGSPQAAEAQGVTPYCCAIKRGTNSSPTFVSFAVTCGMQCAL